MEVHMAKLFSEHNDLSHRAQQIYYILAFNTAPQKQTITYRELATRLGYKGCGTLGRMLGLVAAWCFAHQLPHLTSLVVNQETGLPGEGYPGKDAAADQRKVYTTDWFDIIPPSRTMLSEAYDQHGAELWHDQG
jgi:hypothetical protein